jgi:hypothetical protein
MAFPRGGWWRRFAAVFLVCGSSPWEINEGFAAGCRAGAEAAQSEWLVFFNDDAIPEPGWLAGFPRSGRRASPDASTRLPGG